MKAANGFAVYGIAGKTSGTVDVSELLGGHDISHVSFWATNVSQVEPVVAKVLHGRDFLGNARLAKITDQQVPCLHVETLEPAQCRFTRNSGSWLESSKGRFAKAGQNITLNGKPGGEYIVAAKVGLDGAVSCLAPTGHDSEGYGAGEALSYACAVETALAPTNAVSDSRLVNHATREVCTTSYPHPDDAPLTRSYPQAKSDGTTVTIYCYVGRGAALNDLNGTERDEYGRYYTGSDRCHVMWSNWYEVPAAKRPSTGGWPVRVYPISPVVWRTVDNRVSIAN